MKKNLELFTSFFKIGILTFGGGLAMLPMLTREVVERRKWANNEELLNYYAIGQCTPGVIAVNTATFVGYDQNGPIGAAFATFGVVSPSLIIITVIAALLTAYMEQPVVAHALAGIRIAVCALLLHTIVKLVKSGIKDTFGAVMALLCLNLALFSPVPTIAIVVAAAVAGIFYQMALKNRRNSK